MAWIHAILSRELLAGADVRLRTTLGMRDQDGRSLINRCDSASWWHVQDYAPPLYANTAPGVWRCVAPGHIRLVKVHATRDILTRQVWSAGVSPEWAINYVVDWRPSRAHVGP